MPPTNEKQRAARPARSAVRTRARTGESTAKQRIVAAFEVSTGAPAPAGEEGDADHEARLERRRAVAEADLDAAPDSPELYLASLTPPRRH